MGKGIGELKERTLHAYLKNYLQKDPAKQEVKCCGYVADILDGDKIIEIQTRNFYAMKDKLRRFLEEGYDVTVVYPVTHIKWLIWIEQTDGAVSKKRKSPKTGVPQEIFFEMCYLRELLPHERLHFLICMVNAEEYRNLDGWSKDKKRGSTRAERIPVSIEGWIPLVKPRDFLELMPDKISDPFTVKEFMTACQITEKLASRGISVLLKLGVIERCGKRGRAFLYNRVNESKSPCPSVV